MDYDTWTFNFGTIDVSAEVEYTATLGKPAVDLETGFIQNVLQESVVRYRYSNATAVAAIPCPGQLLDAYRGSDVWVRMIPLTDDE